MPLLAQLNLEGRERGLLMTVGNNIGYFGPYERLWRDIADPDQPYWTGCAAGKTVIGLESDGTVKGCPSLATVGYAGGNVRHLTLEDIWHGSDAIHFGRLRSRDDLWGFCGSCYYAEICRGGCTWTADSLFGRPGNNPYCHYRVLELAKQGLRERVIKVKEADRASFAVGRFDLVTEPIPGAESAVAPPPAPLPRPRARPADDPSDPRRQGRVAPQLDLCRACDCFIWPDEAVCPHCDADVAAAAAAHAEGAARREALVAEVERLVNEVRRQQAGTLGDETV
jgi:radical SAM protein with 4Fe4S-binding SPASM domain